jgi:hypothetical protein
VQSVLKHPDLELIGTWVSSAQKAGRDVGELCGVAPIHMLATQDAEALIAGDADCICYAANSMGREDQVVDDCVRMDAAGKNVVNVSDPALVYPKAKGGNVYDRQQRACLAGNASFYTSGGPVRLRPARHHADTIGVTLDSIDEAHRVVYADEDFDIASGRVPKGTVSGRLFEIRGMVDGEAAGVPFPAPEFNA